MALLALGAGLGACSPDVTVNTGDPPADPTTVEVLMTASPLLNPDGNGRPSPVVVELFELSDANTFNGADFLDLTEKAEDTLGADLLHREELIVFPGDVRTIARDVKPEAAVLGIVVAYRYLGSAIWRDAVALEAGEANPLTADLLSLEVELARRPSEEQVPAPDPAGEGPPRPATPDAPADGADAGDGSSNGDGSGN
jgi:type VI secretion system protein VasD